MRITISNHREIDGVLKQIDQEATEALNNGFKYTVEASSDIITETQFKALHVWLRMCSDYLNSIGMYRYSPVKGIRIPWTDKAFKEDVYKVLLREWKEKDSTKKQNTKDPDEIRLALSGHLATAYQQNIMLPEWPSNR